MTTSAIRLLNRLETSPITVAKMARHFSGRDRSDRPRCRSVIRPKARRSRNSPWAISGRSDRMEATAASVSLPRNRYRKVAEDFCSDQGARKEHSLGYVTEEQRRYGQKDQDLVCNGFSGNDTRAGRSCKRTSSG
jgi:hypothetical protein